MLFLSLEEQTNKHHHQEKPLSKYWRLAEEPLLFLSKKINEHHHQENPLSKYWRLAEKSRRIFLANIFHAIAFYPVVMLVGQLSSLHLVDIR